MPHPQPAHCYRVLDPDINNKRKRVRVVMHMGLEGFVVRWTDACSGCCELGDYGGGSEGYPTDPKHGCLIGSGCHECGYHGKVRREEWIPFDYEAYAAPWDKRWARRERLLNYWRRRAA